MNKCACFYTVYDGLQFLLSQSVGSFVLIFLQYFTFYAGCTYK